MNTGRLKRKLGDLGVDTRSAKVNENFCLVYSMLLPTLRSTLTLHRSGHLYHRLKSRKIMASLYHCGSKTFATSRVAEDCMARSQVAFRRATSIVSGPRKVRIVLHVEG